MHELMMNIGLVGKVYVEFVASDLYFERRESSLHMLYLVPKHIWIHYLTRFEREG